MPLCSLIKFIFFQKKQSKLLNEAKSKEKQNNSLNDIIEQQKLENDKLSKRLDAEKIQFWKKQADHGRKKLSTGCYSKP